MKGIQPGTATITEEDAGILNEAYAKWWHWAKRQSQAYDWQDQRDFKIEEDKYREMYNKHCQNIVERNYK